MSRIDKAFKRAAGLAIDDPAAVQGAPDSSPGSDIRLEDYPQESEPSRPQPVPETAVVPTQSIQPRVPAPMVEGPTGFVGKLIGSERVAPLAVEQYRRLAGAIHELQLERGLRTLMVTSSIPHEGKTLTVSNLALTLSESYGRRVLLIDADLRRPMIHQVFDVDNARGLGDVLRAGDADLPVRQVSANLSVLPAGRSDQPMEALTSEAMRRLLERFATMYDWVLLDAPPVGLMPDARLLAGLTRAVLFVVAAGSTPHTVVTRALGEFDATTVVGTVLNRVEDHAIPANGYYEDYYSSARPSA